MDTFLGIHIVHDEKNQSISMSQSSYLEKMLQKFNMPDCNGVHTPMESGIDLRREKLVEECYAPYRELIGCLTYTTITTRPDLCAATNYFSRFQSCYTDSHFQQAKRILRYVKSTINMKLVYNRNENADPLVGYADADWASDKNDRKSISGFVFKVFGNTVSWSSKKQASVSKSSTEAEYVALAYVMCEGLWLRTLLNELNINCKNATIIHEDNTSCKKIAEEPTESKRLKHVDVSYHFTRDEIEKGKFELQYIQTENQTADIMTKGLGRILFEKHRKNLNLI